MTPNQDIIEKARTLVAYADKNVRGRGVYDKTDLAEALLIAVEALQSVGSTLNYEDCGSWVRVAEMKRAIALEALAAIRSLRCC